MERLREKVKKFKIIVWLLILTMIANLFAPYGFLINTVQAASSTLPKPAIVAVNLTGIQTTGSNRWFQVEFAAVDDSMITAYDFQLAFDNTKFELGNKTTKATATNLSVATTQESSMTTNFATNTSYWNVANGTIRFVGANGAPENPMDYGAASDYGLPYGFDGYMGLYNVTFRVIDPSVTDLI